MAELTENELEDLLNEAFAATPTPEQMEVSKQEVLKRLGHAQPPSGKSVPVSRPVGVKPKAGSNPQSKQKLG